MKFNRLVNGKYDRTLTGILCDIFQFRRALWAIHCLQSHTKPAKREGTCPATINHQIAAQRALGESPRPSSFPFVAHDVIQDASVVSLSFDRRPGAVDGVPVAKRRRLSQLQQRISATF